MTCRSCSAPSNKQIVPLYQALGLHVTYRRVGTVEQVRLRTSLRAVDLERVGVRGPEEDSLVPALRSVDLERVGGGT